MVTTGTFYNSKCDFMRKFSANWKKGRNPKTSKKFRTKVETWKYHSMRYRRGEVALRTTCIKNVKFKIIKIRTGCQYVGYLYYSKNVNWAACGPWVGHSW